MPQKDLKTNNVWVWRLACSSAKSRTQNTWWIMPECQKSCKRRNSLEECQKSQTPSHRERAPCRRHKSTTHTRFGRQRKRSTRYILLGQTGFSLTQPRQDGGIPFQQACFTLEARQKPQKLFNVGKQLQPSKQKRQIENFNAGNFNEQAGLWSLFYPLYTKQKTYKEETQEVN